MTTRQLIYLKGLFAGAALAGLQAAQSQYQTGKASWETVAAAFLVGMLVYVLAAEAHLNLPSPAQQALLSEVAAAMAKWAPATGQLGQVVALLEHSVPVPAPTVTVSGPATVTMAVPEPQAVSAAVGTMSDRGTTMAPAATPPKAVQ